MHQILRRLGNGLEDVFPSVLLSGSSRVKSLIKMLESDNEGDHIAGLTELCEIVSVSSEDAVISFPLEQLVPILIRLLQSNSPDVMLLAVRSITLLADVFPSSTECITRHKAVPVLCEKLLAIEYIDVAEQSIQALEKLSRSHAKVLLRDGALVAVLSFIDFFQIGMQRVAVSTAANICSAAEKSISEESDEALNQACPILINLLSSPDSTIMKKVSQSLTHIVKAYSKSAKKSESLSKLGLIDILLSKVRW